MPNSYVELTLFTKRVLIPLLGVAAAMTASAQTGTDKMVIHRTGGGEPAQIVISNQTKITFDSENMIVSQGDATDDFKIAFADVDKIDFDLNTSSVDDIEAALGDNVVVSVKNGVVVITPADNSVPVTYGVYSVNGLTVASGIADSETTVDFTTMPRGVYVIKANSKVVKFINK